MGTSQLFNNTWGKTPSFIGSVTCLTYYYPSFIRISDKDISISDKGRNRAEFDSLPDQSL